MSEDKEELIAYHGTTKAAKIEITSSGIFRESQSDREWAGTGVYFFIDSSTQLSERHAKQFARYVRKISEREIAVIKAHIDMKGYKVLDLRKDDHQQLFHKYRERLFREEKNRAEKSRLGIKNTFKNVKAFDCYTFNELCNEFGINAVIMCVYINFEKKHYDKFEYTGSSIPNCTIICIKSQKMITKLE